MPLRTIVVLFFLAACSGNAPDQETVPGRWYTAIQVETGAALYQTHCAACHAADGSATTEWRTPDAAGYYPPPPLNGTAHTWHHPLEVLDDTLANGGVEFGGLMPGFADVLDDEQRLAIIAWFQSLWSDDIYVRWQSIDARNRDSHPASPMDQNPPPFLA
jgi:mono/diheme cytochrome c family protein